jgi:hypothetical protein
LFIAGSGWVSLETDITDCDIERTIEGASTLTFKVNDHDRGLLKSGFLGARVDTELDGLFFRLVKVAKTGNDLSLTFEDREIAILRTYNKFIKANRDKTTRAEFVLRMIKEVKEFQIRSFIPELHEIQPIAKADDSADEIDWSRFPGLEGAGEELTVKSVPASTQQKRNGQTVLRVGQSMRVPNVLLIASIMAAIQESTMHNLTGGHLDSVGIFQQRASWGTFEERHNVAKASGKFFRAGMSVLKSAGSAAKGIRPGDLAQMIQRSAYPDAYKQWFEEAKAWVATYAGEDSAFAGFDVEGWGNDTAYEFTRGVPQGDGRYKKENSWDCISRLADEVRWRAFFVSGTFYYISEPELFKSNARLVISERSQGIDDISFDVDVGRPNSTVTVMAHTDRWAAPPGSVVKITGCGPADGRWLVTTIRRSGFSTLATITLKKPVKDLPEPAASQSLDLGGQWGTGPPGATDPRGRIVFMAEKALKECAKTYTYRQYRPMPNSLFSKDARNKLDCSSFATLVYKAANLPDPNGFGYNGSGFTGTLVPNGVWKNKGAPGDMAFYGSNSQGQTTRARPGHVAIYIGGGMCIGFGSTPIKKHHVHYRQDFLGFMDFSSQWIRDRPT